MIIKIFSEFSKDYITREAGERLRVMILEHSKKGMVTLDFENRKVASVSFFDESIGKLSVEGWKLTDLSKHLRYEHFHPLDKQILDRVIQDRFT